MDGEKGISEDSYVWEQVFALFNETLTAMARVGRDSLSFCFHNFQIILNFRLFFIVNALEITDFQKKILRGRMFIYNNDFPIVL